MARGHIRERGDAWELRVSAGTDPVSQRRRVVTRTFRGTRVEAEKALTALLGELDQGAHRGPDGTLGQLLDRWWARGTRASKSGDARWAPATRRGYLQYRKAYLDQHAGMRLSDITGDWLDQWYDQLLERLAPATVKKIHNMLHGALDDAVRWGWLLWNPADRAEPPAVKRRPIKVPPRPKVKAMTEDLVEHDVDYATFVYLHAVIGGRMAEQVGLRWIDLRGSDLHVRRTIVLDEHRRIVIQDDTKTHKARTIHLDASTLEVLELHRIRAKDLAADLGADFDEEWFIFPAAPHRPMEPRTAERMEQRWRRTRDRYGLQGVKSHALRHGMVTHLLDLGVEIHNVAARAGHASANVTWAMYTHPTREGARKAGDAAGL